MLQNRTILSPAARQVLKDSRTARKGWLPCSKTVPFSYQRRGRRELRLMGPLLGHRRRLVLARLRNQRDDMEDDQTGLTIYLVPRPLHNQRDDMSVDHTGSIISSAPRQWRNQRDDVQVDHTGSIISLNLKRRKGPAPRMTCRQIFFAKHTREAPVPEVHTQCDRFARGRSPRVAPS